MTAVQREMPYRSAARSDVGTVRLRNEDAVLERPEIGLWAVADGVGGHQRGDYASRCIVTALGEMPPARSALGLTEQIEPASPRSTATCLRRPLRSASGP